ncbi:MAG: branched-chain amino acid transaminase [Deltaproteobacteria bacterium]|nr:branched-chain amino acid transaminase [Deltaproteobacteria bacterium]
MAIVEKASKIWLDGALRPWDDAQIHVLTHTLHYGLGVFEGIRCYKGKDRSYVFRLKEHIDRLFQSAQMVLLDMPFTREQLMQGCFETLRANNQQEAYVRPLAFMGAGEMGVGSMSNPTRISIITWYWGPYLGKEGVEKGIRCRVSGFRRMSNHGFLAKGKICGQYVNSILAKREALLGGFNEAIMLDDDGFVAEATGENIFLVKNGVLRTPPYGAQILGGLTRDTVIKLAEDMGLKVTEARFARDELYTADEVFLTGTAAEITPVREIDHRTIGSGAPGPVVQKIRETYMAVVRGERPEYERWLAPL